MVPLPIDPILPDALARLREHRSLVLVAEPGAGKTTRLPPALLKSDLLSREHPNVVLLQPRRVAARAAANRIAEENGWELGGVVGYQIRFERRIGRDTRLHVMTEGVLTRQLLDDPILEGVGCVILDEFHERSLHTDLAIALLREVRQTVRPDLMIVVMSATLEAEPVARFLGNAPILRSAGRTFPVDISHAGATPRIELPQRIASLIDAIVCGTDRGLRHTSDTGVAANEVPRDDGDVLVFLPGVAEINRAIDALEPVARREDLLVLPLHGSLSGDEQFAALRPAERRKIVVATNIAETSLTIDGVTTVIDSGLARVAGFDPQRGMDRLELKRISRASATQRAGRAGRTRPGRCVRLWSAIEDKALEEFETPEVQRVDLTATVLALHAWGASDPRTFGWYEPPDERAIASAERLLEMLGATTSESGGKITDIGRKLLSLPVHPRLGRLLLAAAEAGMTRDGAAIAALLSEKDILRTRSDVHPRDRAPATQAASDLLIRLDALESRRADVEIDRRALRQVEKARDELERIARRLSPSPRESRGEGEARGRSSRGSPDSAGAQRLSPSPPEGEGGGEGEARERSSRGFADRLGGESANRASSGHTVPPHPSPLPPGEREQMQMLLRLPLWAYPDRVCRRRANDPSAGMMVGGGGVRLAPESVVRQHEFFLALDARQDQRILRAEAIVSIASAIEVAWLEEEFGQEIRRVREAVYDEQRDRVVGRGQVFYRDLLLREDKDAAVDAEIASRVLAEWATPRASEILRSDEPAARWLSRVELLRKAMPDKPWPAAPAGEVIAVAAAGKRSLAELRAALLPALEGILHYPLDRLLDTEAPETIEVPTGNRIRLDYPQQSDDARIDPPVLAIRLQELFGWTQTPRIAGGRVPVRLHLLGPNFRPVQITDDLRSFWSTTYFQVRKDLRVRYPKHSWPDDPLSAKPQAKGGRRR